MYLIWNGANWVEIPESEAMVENSGFSAEALEEIEEFLKG